MPPRRVNVRVKVENPFQIIKRLFKYIFKINGWKLFLVLGLIVVSSICAPQPMIILGELIDDMDNIVLNQDYQILWTCILKMALFYLISIVSGYVYSYIMIFVTQDTLKQLRDDLFKHMETLPINYFDSHNTGEIMSTFTNDTDSLRQLISQTIPSLLSSIITIVYVFIQMTILSWILTLISVLFIVIMMIVTKILGSKSSNYFLQQQNALSKINGFIEEMIEGQKVIKVFNHEEVVKNSFDELNSTMREVNYKANSTSMTLMPILHNLGYFSFAITALVGSLLAVSGFPGFSAGVFVSFLMLNKQFTNPISQISNQINFIFMALAGSKRIFDILDQKSEVDDGYVTLVNVKENEDGTIQEVDYQTNVWAWKHPHSDGSTTLTKLTGDVRMFDVDFGYVEEKIVLHNISLYAKPGQKIAFVGATGAGKTTITNLLNRFYDIQDGKIRYDGINLNKIKKKDLRTSLGIVLQDTHLFSGTIKENIKYGKRDATDEEVIKAAKLANADQFINLLENGYDTYITGDGGNLSQGQRQLLAIARVIIANPPVLILDEATSSIDTWTESLVQAGMDELMKGRTVFVIAHRLSTIQNSNAIMVLDKGRIIERGDHDDLIKLKGVYYQLYTGAFELE